MHDTRAKESQAAHGLHAHGAAILRRMAASDPLIGEIVDERWKIVERLGAGAMGVVYKAERLKLGKPVAVKFLDERCARSKESVARFDREARAISRVQHAHCVSILDFGVHKKRPYIVMEYVPGRRLNQELGKPTMTVPRAMKIMRQLLEGLRHAHAHGVVHRDLKPDNVMLAEVTGTDDFVKILDFGLARIISVDEPSISLPQVVAGTPSYMSPEQAQGKKADHRSDLYSAGVMLYAMCVGKKPFYADDEMELVRMHIHAAPPPPRKAAPQRNLSAALERVILRALTKDREQRFLTAQEFLDALASTPEGRASVGRPARRVAYAAGIAAALLLVAAGAGGALLVRSGAMERPAQKEKVETPVVKKIEPPPPPKPEPPKVEVAKPDPEPEVKPEPAKPEPPKVEVAVNPVPEVKREAPKVEPPKVEEAKPEPPKAEPPKMEVANVEPPKPEPPKVEVAPNAPPNETANGKGLAERNGDPWPPAIAALIAKKDFREAQKRLLDTIQTQPTAAWPHLALAEVYYRQLWRKDAAREWDEALRLEPQLARDPRLGAELCDALAPAWQGAGERLLTSRFGAEAVAPMTACLQKTRDLSRLNAAARVLEKNGGADRGLVALRTLELAPDCETRRRAVATVAELHEPRAVAALTRLEAARLDARGRPVAEHACLGTSVQEALRAASH